MAITLGTYTFDTAHTSVREEYEEVGGRDQRTILVKGLIAGKSTVPEIESELDSIIDAASVEDYSVALSVRGTRRMMVRRQGYRREVLADSLVGSFTLELGAKEPFEESVAENSEAWNIAASGATLAVSSSGNVHARPKITLVASGSLVNPSVSDDTRAIAYAGTIADTSTLVFDGETETATLDGVDVTPYTSGLFPQIDPAGTTLTYTDDATSSHTASGAVAHRDRWW